MLIFYKTGASAGKRHNAKLAIKSKGRKPIKMQEKVLVLFSGGMDSFLTVCRLANSKKKAILISFNGGGLVGEENLKHGANRLINRFGEQYVEYAGVYPTVSTIMRLNREWVYSRQDELGKNYPSATNCQFQCLHCQTAIWIAAIAYCKAKGITTIAAGYKKTDVFCTGLDAYITRIKTLANAFGISIELPVWDLGDDFERQLEVGSFQFEPRVLEPKCLLGNPVMNGFPKDEKKDIVKYFDDNLSDKLKDYVNNLIPIFRHIKLSDKSFKTMHYPEITGKNGLY